MHLLQTILSVPVYIVHFILHAYTLVLPRTSPISKECGLGAPDQRCNIKVQYRDSQRLLPLPRNASLADIKMQACLLFDELSDGDLDESQVLIFFNPKHGGTPIPLDSDTPRRDYIYPGSVITLHCLRTPTATVTIATTTSR
jgi:hypothetical protein